MAARAGTIAGTPGDDGLVMVRLPQLDGGVHQHGPCPWPPRPDGVEPRRGDRCVVLEDDAGGLWVVGWEPA